MHLYILFSPLYTFCNELDVLAVCTADYGLLSDLYAVCNKCTCDDCTVFYDCTGHQHAVDDLSCLRRTLSIREQDGIL